MNSNERERYLDAGFPDYKDPQLMEGVSFGRQLYMKNMVESKQKEIIEEEKLEEEYPGYKNGGFIDVEDAEIEDEIYGITNFVDK